MAGASQAATVALLADPATHGGQAVEHIETHISHVFLAGERAYKLKRAVRYPYLDFSTPALRRAACEAELVVNRRTAPSLYRRVVPISRDPNGALALDGGGTAVDWVVEMARFDQTTLFDRLAQTGGLTPALVDALADAVAAFHDQAERVETSDGARPVRAVIDGNAEAMALCADDGIDPGLARAIHTNSLAMLDRVAGRLDDRARSGHVRDLHGDLHLRNICLVAGAPTLFDAIEFDPALRRIDTLYDLAFLLMDMVHRGLREEAGRLLNRYLDRRGDEEGLAALPLFLSMRAAIRAHVSASAAAADRTQGIAWRAEEADYLRLAGDFLKPVPPALIAIGGLSGTGKSTLARALSSHIGPAPGPRLLRSDVIRKRLAGVEDTDRLTEEHYTEAFSDRTYAVLNQRAKAALQAGHTVIFDAVAGTAGQRAAIRSCAAAANASFHGLWLDAPLGVKEARVAQRIDDASDADIAVVRAQSAASVGDAEWVLIDAGGALDRTVRQALAALSDCPALIHPASD
jgi:aminoglycoside phosphotransferase family enzyme/predicted kinase